MTPSRSLPIEPNRSGSEKHTNEPDFLVIGQIVKPHGIRGEVSVKILTEFPERFDEMDAVYLGDAHSARLVGVESVRWHKEHVLIRFDSFADRTAAEKLRGQYLKVPRDSAVKLDDGVFYHYQLEGLAVVTDTGEPLGKLSYVLETGANDVYVIATPDGELLLPATHEVIRDINLAEKIVTVHLIPGLR